VCVCVCVCACVCVCVCVCVRVRVLVCLHACSPRGCLRERASVVCGCERGVRPLKCAAVRAVLEGSVSLMGVRLLRPRGGCEDADDGLFVCVCVSRAFGGVCVADRMGPLLKTSALPSHHPGTCTVPRLPLTLLRQTKIRKTPCRPRCRLA